MTPAEFHKLYDCTGSQHTKDLLLFGYWTGCHAGEIMKLKWSMIDLRKRIITLPAEITKEGRAKKVPISDAVYGILTRDGRFLRAAGIIGYVFTYQNKPITRAFTTGLKTASDAAGIPWGRETDGGWIFHDLRRTFKTEMRRAGVHKSVMDAIVGHADHRDMDTHYNIIEDSDLHEAMKKLAEFRLKNSEEMAEKPELFSANVD